MMSMNKATIELLKLCVVHVNEPVTEIKKVFSFDKFLTSNPKLNLCLFNEEKGQVDTYTVLH